MGKLKKYMSWALLAIVIIIALFVGRSIWFSLQDTRAKLEEQHQKMRELEGKNAALHAYTDSLDNEITRFRAEESRLIEERNRLEARLQAIEQKYQATLAKIDNLWEADAITQELDDAFPHWKGQFWAAMRSDSVHGLIAPQFFGAEVVEIKAKLDNSLAQTSIKDSTIANLDSTVQIKDFQLTALGFKADSLNSAYENLWVEYQGLDKKYDDLLKKKWFTLHLNLAHILTTGAGFAAGYVASNQINKAKYQK